MADDMGYEVGYRKPPKAFRFRKGRSGNRSGRPRKVRSPFEVLAKIAKQKVLVRGKNGPKYMTKEEAGFTQLMNKVANGDLKAIDLYVKYRMIYSPGMVKPEDMEAMASSARAKLFKMFEVRDNSTEGTTERDQLCGPNESNVTDAAESNEAGADAQSGEAQPVSQAVETFDTSMTITPRPAQGLHESKARSVPPPPQSSVLNAPKWEITDE